MLFIVYIISFPSCGDNIPYCRTKPPDFPRLFEPREHTMPRAVEVFARGCDQIMRVGFTLLGISPDITDRISSIAVGQ